jgi:hypothetical protein
MYIPYRKAYISGIDPLSFVTVFTVGELSTVLALVLALEGGFQSPVFHSPEVRPLLFWLFLGGFVWVIGDIFQQFATKYIGIGRGIPLSNTNQLWGLAWGCLVFGELAHATMRQELLAVLGSIMMILGALAVSTAVAGARENASTEKVVKRECDRYNLDYRSVLEAYRSSESGGLEEGRSWWDYAIVVAAVSVFLYLGVKAGRPAIPVSIPWTLGLSGVMVAALLGCGFVLLRRSPSQS